MSHQSKISGNQNCNNDSQQSRYKEKKSMMLSHRATKVYLVSAGISR